MAYTRGDCYIWDDGHRFHFWKNDGYDGWEESGWAQDESGTRHSDRESASGVGIEVDVIDAFVMMRLAELIVEGKAQAVIDRAVGEFGGNIGGQMLKENASVLKGALDTLRLIPPK